MSKRFYFWHANSIYFSGMNKGFCFGHADLMYMLSAFSPLEILTNLLLLLCHSKRNSGREDNRARTWPWQDVSVFQKKFKDVSGIVLCPPKRHKNRSRTVISAKRQTRAAMLRTDHTRRSVSRQRQKALRPNGIKVTRTNGYFRKARETREWWSFSRLSQAAASTT